MRRLRFRILTLVATVMLTALLAMPAAAKSHPPRPHPGPVDPPVLVDLDPGDPGP